ncbi:MAG: hypothetical protein ACYC8T_25775 [Myxococcaceae bacterium]
MKRRASASVDPLRLLSRGRPKAGPARRLRFGSGEHVWLGNAGAATACVELRRGGYQVDDETFLNVHRLYGGASHQYGELVALSGDFYDSPSELYEERPSAVPWRREANDHEELRKMFAVELGWIEDRQRGRGTEAYPDLNLRMAWSAKAYVELALRNVDHFGWHNQLAYCRYHGAALGMAVSAEGRADERWARALVYNAFADHFLTDGFAAGHIRVPRAEIRLWCEGQGLSDKLAGALSKVLHDQDGHVEGFHGAGEDNRKDTEGLPVCNSKGDAWRTFCDGQLFLFPGATSRPEVQRPVRAVAESVKELVAAWKKGVLPKGVFSATREVPFPDPRSPGLAEKFSAGMSPRRVEALVKSIAWYAKVPWLGPGLRAKHVQELFGALPELMKRFRANVKADLDRDPSLGRRLPSKYIEAFRALG